MPNHSLKLIIIVHGKTSTCIKLRIQVVVSFKEIFTTNGLQQVAYFHETFKHFKSISANWTDCTVTLAVFYINLSNAIDLVAFWHSIISRNLMVAQKCQTVDFTWISISAIIYNNWRKIACNPYAHIPKLIRIPIIMQLKMGKIIYVLVCFISPLKIAFSMI